MNRLPDNTPTTAMTWARTSNAEQIATNAQPPKRCHVRVGTNNYENKSGCCLNHVNRRCCRRGSWQLRLESSTHRSQSPKPHTVERKHNRAGTETLHRKLFHLSR